MVLTPFHTTWMLSARAEKLLEIIGRCLEGSKHIKQLRWQGFRTSSSYPDQIQSVDTAPPYSQLKGVNKLFIVAVTKLTNKSTIQLILKVIKPVLCDTVNEIEVKIEAEQSWVHGIQDALKSRVYADDCGTVSFFPSAKGPWHDS
jgi:hypothetical protein